MSNVLNKIFRLSASGGFASLTYTIVHTFHWLTQWLTPPALCCWWRRQS